MIGAKVATDLDLLGILDDAKLVPPLHIRIFLDGFADNHTRDRRFDLGAFEIDIGLCQLGIGQSFSKFDSGSSCLKQLPLILKRDDLVGAENSLPSGLVSLGFAGEAFR